MIGELVTEVLDYDGGRGVTVYTPRARVEVVIFAGDGQEVAQWGTILEAAHVPPTMIVGVHAHPDETLRLHEYSPVFDATRFAAHETFFTHEVPQWVHSRFGIALPAPRTAVFGASAGGELALALGLRHPDLFGAVFSGSPGAGYRPGDELPTRIPRTYIFAGTEEPFFLDNAARWTVALRNAGADVVLRQRDGDHGDELWRAELPLMVAWAFS